MESGLGKTRMNVQGDRLSNLPDDLIHKILSFVGILLSKQVLGHIDGEVSSAKLSFRGKASQVFAKRILDYAFSHNVKQLTVSCLPDNSAIEVPLSLLSSQSLKHLTFSGFPYVSSVILTSTWELASLTTLHIEDITFKDEVTAKDTGIFSKCVNLKKLVLKNCSMTRSNGVDIFHPGLSDLTLENGAFFENVINVVAPQLKNLTVRFWEGLHLISITELVSLHFEGWHSQWLQFSSFGLCSLENVDLCIFKSCLYKPNKPDTLTIFDQIQQLHSVKYLTLNVEMFQFGAQHYLILPVAIDHFSWKYQDIIEDKLLSPLMELISHQPSPVVNLKSLKVYPGDSFVKVLETIPAEVKKYLLDGSPSATFTEVSFEEMRALKLAESALNCMAELREMLEHEKANNIRSNKGKAKTSVIISKLCHIEELLIELPASKRAQIETSFSRLCMEADVVMNAIMNCVKIQSDEKQSRFKSDNYIKNVKNWWHTGIVSSAVISGFNAFCESKW
ncbi:F-box domain, Leucine-rich repeat domain, L domain-like protein [Artemisia annua]|uniref:F-box domain, Leucine-rich repeat domain, L domain-like protein n=1 Tax=Artemisia annua TaxID=35608 RepID=A0A2U1Q696_ARTAN|nr:F-box domain, Leucine-rich repeat domain, L domain-like protein [Artemisia annua]